jgi:hypothetical protein
VPIGAAIVAIIGLSIGAAFGGGSVPPFSDAQRHFWDRPAAIDRVVAIAAMVPPDAPRAVDWGIASAVASRHHVEILSSLTDDAYILLDADPYVSGSVRWKDRTALVMGLPESGRALLVDDGRFTLWGPLGG